MQYHSPGRTLIAPLPGSATLKAEEPCNTVL